MITKEDKNYLFVPFTDATNRVETYEGGKYLDLTIQDIANNTLVIDFNTAYNPYCCYVAGYSSLVPPKENALEVSINAGEKTFGKSGYYPAVWTNTKRSISTWGTIIWVTMEAPRKHCHLHLVHV